MAVTALHSIFGVELGATLIGGISRQNIVIDSDIRGGATSGEVYDRLLSMYAQRVAPSFTTDQIASALDECAGVGAAIDDMTGGFSLWAHKREHGSTHDSGAVHTEYNFDSGILVPRTLSARHGTEPATIDYDAIVVSDGDDPLTITETQSIPAGLLAAQTETFGLGPVTVGSKALAQVDSLDITFGIDAFAIGADGELFETLACIRKINSEIVIRGTAVGWFSSTNVPLAGLACTHANSKLYLRKRAQGGTYETDVTTVHISFTFDGHAVVRELGGDQAGDQQVEIRIPLKYDGTLTPLVIDTATAIT